jgi:hypothetical protein
VPVNYGRRALQKTQADIDKYSSWGTQNVNLAMQGIFLDESPQVADNHNTTYVKNVRKHLKSKRALSNGLLGKRFCYNTKEILTSQSDESWYDTRWPDSTIGRPNRRLRRNVSNIPQLTDFEAAIDPPRSQCNSVSNALDTKKSVCRPVASYSKRAEDDSWKRFSDRSIDILL